MVDYLSLDGWICRKMEQNFSEKKTKSVGEWGMADQLCIRYEFMETFNEGINTIDLDEKELRSVAQVLWIEFKREGVKGAPKHQELWHILERKRGALTLIAGEDFKADFYSFKIWYEQSGLRRRV